MITTQSLDGRVRELVVEYFQKFHNVTVPSSNLKLRLYRRFAEAISENEDEDEDGKYPFSYKLEQDMQHKLKSYGWEVTGDYSAPDTVQICYRFTYGEGWENRLGFLERIPEENTMAVDEKTGIANRLSKFIANSGLFTRFERFLKTQRL